MRERIEDANKADRFYAALAGKQPMNQTVLPPKREYRRNPTGKRLERDVLAEVLEALRRDPRVALVERQQSGVFMEGNRYIRVGTKGALDVRGYLVGGRGFEIECKSDSGRLTPEQSERIATLLANGVVAGVATCAAEALAILPT